jgi:transposase
VAPEANANPSSQTIDALTRPPAPPGHPVYAASLRQHAARTSEASVARRLLGLALVLEGHGRAEAAKSCGMDRQTLRDWVIRYNAQGIAGLSDRPHGGGAAPKLSAEERVQLSAWVRHGPDIAEDGVVRWRLRDLRDRIMARFFVLMDERSVGRILKTFTFSHMSVRPRHPQADAAAQEAHTKKLCRIGCCRHPHGRARQADRAVVAGRSPCWSARQSDPHLGPARQPPPLRCAINVTNGPICSAPFAQHAGWALGSCCRTPRWRG